MMSALSEYLQQHTALFLPVVQLAADEGIAPLDLSVHNPQLSPEIVSDTDRFSQLIHAMLAGKGCRYGIGGYNEQRNLYARSQVFDGAEPRRLHLGVDIWGPAGTPVYAPMKGILHSLAYNDQFGDYGATILVEHQLADYRFYTLYGHLSLASLNDKAAGQAVAAGEWLASFGPPAENGGWPPHLHFQVIADLEGMMGDYPGVCRYSEREKYLHNCPDPNLLLGSLHQRIRKEPD